MNNINKPAITNLIIKATADKRFSHFLLADPQGAMEAVGLPESDRTFLADIQAKTMIEFLHQIKARLLT